MSEDLYNGGKDGFFTRDTRWKADHDAREEERDKQHAANITRLNLLIGLAMAILTVLLIIATLVGPVLKSHSKGVHVSSDPDPELSYDVNP